jgi:hypothetical protein
VLQLMTGGGSVTAHDTLAGSNEEKTEVVVLVGRRVGQRACKPNPRVCGPEWSE